ncbi:acetyl-CoA carboxylase carboxyltransferase subunit alpha/beta [Pseudarthrobacter sp. NS4]|uniref:acetyl-CoA carboxylase carboxyltransferase subunit alpha/beta n=1 Tax=Pseudarthrobacter sp. NS4 TaxID=2973976 RepID=UPI002161817C|nr:acetyl-CoA carboxylase carboxyltransferase subunit alpha/beta [Pseudarthrobacter sp. NS4]
MTPLPPVARIRPEELLALTLDTGSFLSWDQPLPPLAIEEGYGEELAAARLKSGHDESIITGEGRIKGQRVAVVLGEFAFLGGSIGVNAATRITEAIHRATQQGLPLLASPVSGGTRMQEGTAAFVQMARITAAVNAHKHAHLPYLVYLRHPTTGGVFASWGSLGHITAAQPQAMIGFLGPKVYKAISGEDFPAGIQQAENLHRHGVVDAVIDPRHLRSFIIRILNVVYSAFSVITHDLPASDVEDTGDTDAWSSVTLSRLPQRPGLRKFLSQTAVDVIPIGGSAGDPGGTVSLALARLGNQGAVVVGLDREAADDGARFGPAELREARRGMNLAAGLGLPLLTVIDTPGADLSKEAEEGGLSREIAFTLARLLELPVPTVTLLLGQGAGGGALALFPADRIIALSSSWLAPLLPEGASAIMHEDTQHAALMARRQRVGAAAMLLDGLVDEVVAEPSGTEGHKPDFCGRAASAVARHLGELATRDPDVLVRERSRRYSTGAALYHAH